MSLKIHDVDPNAQDGSVIKTTVTTVPVTTPSNFETIDVRKTDGVWKPLYASKGIDYTNVSEGIETIKTPEKTILDISPIVVDTAPMSNSYNSPTIDISNSIWCFSSEQGIVFYKEYQNNLTPIVKYNIPGFGGFTEGVINSKENIWGFGTTDSSGIFMLKYNKELEYFEEIQTEITSGSWNPPVIDPEEGVWIWSSKFHSSVYITNNEGYIIKELKDVGLQERQPLIDIKNKIFAIGLPNIRLYRYDGTPLTFSGNYINGKVQNGWWSLNSIDTITLIQFNTNYEIVQQEHINITVETGVGTPNVKGDEWCYATSSGAIIVASLKDTNNFQYSMIESHITDLQEFSYSVNGNIWGAGGSNGIVFVKYNGEKIILLDTTNIPTSDYRSIPSQYDTVWVFGGTAMTTIDVNFDEVKLINSMYEESNIRNPKFYNDVLAITEKDLGIKFFRVILTDVLLKNALDIADKYNLPGNWNPSKTDSSGTYLLTPKDAENENIVKWFYMNEGEYNVEIDTTSYKGYFNPAVVDEKYKLWFIPSANGNGIYVVKDKKFQEKINLAEGYSWNVFIDRKLEAVICTSSETKPTNCIFIDYKDGIIRNRNPILLVVPTLGNDLTNIIVDEYNSNWLVPEAPVVVVQSQSMFYHLSRNSNDVIVVSGQTPGILTGFKYSGYMPQYNYWFFCRPRTSEFVWYEYAKNMKHTMTLPVQGDKFYYAVDKYTGTICIVVVSDAPQSTAVLYQAYSDRVEQINTFTIDNKEIRQPLISIDGLASFVLAAGNIVYKITPEEYIVRMNLPAEVTSISSIYIDYLESRIVAIVKRNNNVDFIASSYSSGGATAGTTELIENISGTIILSSFNNATGMLNIQSDKLQLFKRGDDVPTLAISYKGNQLNEDGTVITTSKYSIYYEKPYLIVSDGINPPVRKQHIGTDYLKLYQEAVINTSILSGDSFAGIAPGAVYVFTLPDSISDPSVNIIRFNINANVDSNTKIAGSSRWRHGGPFMAESYNYVFVDNNDRIQMIGQYSGLLSFPPDSTIPPIPHGSVIKIRSYHSIGYIFMSNTIHVIYPTPLDLASTAHYNYVNYYGQLSLGNVQINIAEPAYSIDPGLLILPRFQQPKDQSCLMYDVAITSTLNITQKNNADAGSMIYNRSDYPSGVYIKYIKTINGNSCLIVFNKSYAAVTTFTSTLSSTTTLPLHSSDMTNPKPPSILSDNSYSIGSNDEYGKLILVINRGTHLTGTIPTLPRGQWDSITKSSWNMYGSNRPGIGTLFNFNDINIGLSIRGLFPDVMINNGVLTSNVIPISPTIIKPPVNAGGNYYYGIPIPSYIISDRPIATGGMLYPTFDYDNDQIVFMRYTPYNDYVISKKNLDYLYESEISPPSNPNTSLVVLDYDRDLRIFGIAGETEIRFSTLTTITKITVPQKTDRSTFKIEYDIVNKIWLLRRMDEILVYKAVLDMDGNIIVSQIPLPSTLNNSTNFTTSKNGVICLTGEVTAFVKYDNTINTFTILHQYTKQENCIGKTSTTWYLIEGTKINTYSDTEIIPNEIPEDDYIAGESSVGGTMILSNSNIYLFSNVDDYITIPAILENQKMCQYDLMKNIWCVASDSVAMFYNFNLQPIDTTPLIISSYPDPVLEKILVKKGVWLYLHRDINERSYVSVDVNRIGALKILAGEPNNAFTFNDMNYTLAANFVNDNHIYEGYLTHNVIPQSTEPLSYPPDEDNIISYINGNVIMFATLEGITFINKLTNTLIQTQRCNMITWNEVIVKDGIWVMTGDSNIQSIYIFKQEDDYIKYIKTDTIETGKLNIPDVQESLILIPQELFGIDVYEIIMNEYVYMKTIFDSSTCQKVISSYNNSSWIAIFDVGYNIFGIDTSNNVNIIYSSDVNEYTSATFENNTWCVSGETNTEIIYIANTSNPTVVTIDMDSMGSVYGHNIWCISGSSGIKFYYQNLDEFEELTTMEGMYCAPILFNVPTGHHILNGPEFIISSSDGNGILFIDVADKNISVRTTLNIPGNFKYAVSGDDGYCIYIADDTLAFSKYNEITGEITEVDTSTLENKNNRNIQRKNITTTWPLFSTTNGSSVLVSTVDYVTSETYTVTISGITPQFVDPQIIKYYISG